MTVLSLQRSLGSGRESVSSGRGGFQGAEWPGCLGWWGWQWWQDYRSRVERVSWAAGGELLYMRSGRLLGLCAEKWGGLLSVKLETAFLCVLVIIPSHSSLWRWMSSGEVRVTCIAAAFLPMLLTARCSRIKEGGIIHCLYQAIQWVFFICTAH